MPFSMPLKKHISDSFRVPAARSWKDKILLVNRPAITLFGYAQNTQMTDDALASSRYSTVSLSLAVALHFVHFCCICGSGEGWYRHIRIYNRVLSPLFALYFSLCTQFSPYHNISHFLPLHPTRNDPPSQNQMKKEITKYNVCFGASHIATTADLRSAAYFSKSRALNCRLRRGEVLYGVAARMSVLIGML
jgi:hypothetical protein